MKNKKRKRTKKINENVAIMGEKVENAEVMDEVVDEVVEVIDEKVENVEAMGNKVKNAEAIDEKVRAMGENMEINDEKIGNMKNSNKEIHNTKNSSKKICDATDTEFMCGEVHHHRDIVEKVARDMPTAEEIQGVADLFKIFGDITRIQILTALYDSELCVCDLSQLINMTQSAVSHQLKTLRAGRLVKSRRVGKSMYYSLDDDHVASILGKGVEHIRHN